MNLVSLLIATSVVRYSSNVGLRTGIALAAVIIVIAVIVMSKRRAGSYGEEAPASTETGGATAPAAVSSPVEADTAEAGAADAATAASAAEDSPNGQVATGKPAGTSTSDPDPPE